jgi:DtxR family Mn-dependent transcriptional regulator
MISNIEFRIIVERGSSMRRKELSESLEDYLEAILSLQDQNRQARVKDIADLLGVKRSSVTVALRTLAEKELVNYLPYSKITLTIDGLDVANSVRDRHNILKRFFTEILSVEPNLANESACKMEHSMGKVLYGKLKSLLQVFDENVDVKNDVVNKTLELYCSSKQKEMVNKLKWISLSDCNPGEQCVIKKLKGSSIAKKRYLEMGLMSGQDVELVKTAPLNDPIEIKVGNYHLSIRRSEAKNIMVDRLGVADGE